MVTKLKYGNTNTYFIRGAKGSIMLDTDYSGTLQMFYKEIKKNGISLKDITYIIAAGVDLQSVVQSVRDKLSADIIIKQTSLPAPFEP